MRAPPTAKPAIARRQPTAEPAAAVPARPVNRTGLPDRLKYGIETLSGVAMDDVRVHRNSPRPKAVGALAYAQGRQIHLAPGQDRHLPHEAWHVVQQSQRRVRPTLRLKGGEAVNDHPALEREADAMGARAAGMRFAPAAAEGRCAGDANALPAAGGVAQRMMEDGDDDTDDEHEQKQRTPRSGDADDSASSSPQQASTASSSSGPGRPFPNLLTVGPSSEKHHFDTMHKNWQEQLKSGHFSFVKPNVERGHIAAINAYIHDGNNPGQQPASTRHDVSHESFLEPKRDRKTGGNVVDPHTGEDQLFLRHEFTVAGNRYSTHLDTAQLYPMSGPDILSGTGPSHMRDVVEANPDIPSRGKIAKAVDKLGFPVRKGGKK